MNKTTTYIITLFLITSSIKAKQKNKLKKEVNKTVTSISNKDLSKKLKKPLNKKIYFPCPYNTDKKVTHKPGESILQMPNNTEIINETNKKNSILSYEEKVHNKILKKNINEQ